MTYCRICTNYNGSSACPWCHDALGGGCFRKDGRTYTPTLELKMALGWYAVKIEERRHWRIASARENKEKTDADRD